VPDSSAQSYPLKPIRIVVGYTAGGGTDVTARIVAQKLSEQFGQPVVVENRAGAGGTIAAARVAASPADGYTLLLVTAADPVQSALRANLPYDLERDSAPVSLVAVGPFVLVVHPSVPARNVKELIALARSRPGKLSYGSAGVGTATHLAGELFNLMAKSSLAHVPYKGSSESAIATAAGQIDMSFPDATAVLPLVDAGRLKALAVTSAKRASMLPSMPTLSESGLPGYDYSTWKGVLAPAGVPKDIIARLNAVIGKAVDTPEIKESLNKQGLDPQTSTPEQFAALIHGDIAKNAKLIALAGVKVE
jgi:tripartite-type tricarboxylate transporter receptor subunit TctC